MLPCTPSWILHLDLDAFFASVEQRDDPTLRNLPVAVGTGVVASCSYEAKARGVTTGMSLAEARRRCPALRVLPGDYRRYEQAARRVQAICLDRTPRVEVAALDDLYLDLTGAHLPRPAHLARDLARQVADEVGLRASIGCGSSKFVARVATRLAKQLRLPGPHPPANLPPTGVWVPGLVVVPPGHEQAFLAPWPVEVLLGVGPRCQARLEQLNVRRVGEVAGMPPAVLAGLFGARGRVLRDLAHGIDPRPVEPDRLPRSIARRTSFDPPLADTEQVRAMLRHLVERATSAMRSRLLWARGLTISVRYGDGRSAEARQRFPRFTDEEGPFLEAATDCLVRLTARRLPLRLVGVELSPLRPADGQGELFVDPDAERARRLLACKDAIRRRFGFMALVPGTSLLLASATEHDRDNFRLRTPCLTR
jgi:DNA polymerase-4